MNCQNKLDFDRLLGIKVLLYGETNTYKTFCSAKYVQYLMEDRKIDPNHISIIEFAPKLQTIDDLKIGGKVKDYFKESKLCKYLETDEEIIPPRLHAKNRKELYSNVCHNYRQTRLVLQEFNEKPTPYLIINDISIYLHLGDKRDLIKAIENANNVIGNAYYGKNISQKAKFARIFSLKEQIKIKNLRKYFDKTILMEKS